jgi:predicted aspartyl protease
VRAFWLLAIWVAGSVSVPRAAFTIADAGIAPFERGYDDIVIAVRLNGRGPFRLLLDTGSTHTAVSAGTAAEIHAPVVAKAAMGSAAGSRDTLVVRIDALEVGPVTTRDVLASVVELTGMPDLAGVDGVIGHDALAPLHYTIDFGQRHVVWWPTAERVARGHALELQSSHGRFIVALPQRQSVLRLVPDTGSKALLLFDPDRRLPVTRLRAPATLTTSSGATSVQLARMRELQIGGLALHDIPAVIAERDRSEPDEIDGLLPLHLFDRVTVDGPGMSMTVEKSRTNGLMFF